MFLNLYIRRDFHEQAMTAPELKAYAPDAIEEGDRTKQILKNGQVTIKEEGFVTFH